MGDVPPQKLKICLKLLDRWPDLVHSFLPNFKKKTVERRGYLRGDAPPQKLKIFLKLMDRWPDLVHSFAKLKRKQ